MTAETCALDASSKLETIEDMLAKQTTVLSISGPMLTEAIDDDLETVQIFDVREPDEYAVSRLAQATLVSPAISADEFLQMLPPDLSGQTFVFYCSVGRRSSTFAELIGPALKARSAKATYNLRGGIFRWRGLGLPLVNATGPTIDVHPFSSVWQTFLPPAPATQTPAGA